jgi:hypothetical protein
LSVSIANCVANIEAPLDAMKFPPAPGARRRDRCRSD